METLRSAASGLGLHWAVRSKVVVLLMLIYCLMYFPLFVGVLCLSLFCYALPCVHSSFAIESWLLCYHCLTDVLFYKCSVTLPHGAMGCSAVCDCGIS